MPWNDNSNGGGPWGSGSGGGKTPWGSQPPRGGGPRRPGGPGNGGGGQPPDLETLIRQLQDRFSGGFGGGRRGAGGKGGGAGLLVLLAILGLGAWILGTGWYIVQPAQQGVVLRFGKIERVSDPGFHLKLPSPIETVEAEVVEELQEITIGDDSVRRNGGLPEGLMLTGDQNIVNLVFTVQWEVGNRMGLDFGALVGPLNPVSVERYGAADVFADGPQRGVIIDTVTPGLDLPAEITRGTIITTIADQTAFSPLEAARLASLAARRDEPFALGVITPDGTETSVTVTGVADEQVPVGDVENYLFRIDEPETTLRSVAESAMREVIGQTGLQPIIANEIREINERVQVLIQETLDAYDAGIEVSTVIVQRPSLPDVKVELENPDDPAALAQVSPLDAFRDVVDAQNQAIRAEQDAQAYANRVIPTARGDAERIIQEAQGYRDAVIAEARGQSERFGLILEQYAEYPEIVRIQRHRETMERILENSEIILLDENGGDSQGVVPFLPLTEFTRRSPAANQ